MSVDIQVVSILDVINLILLFGIQVITGLSHYISHAPQRDHVMVK